MSWDIAGHDWAVDLLSRHVANGSARHAYLFTGPPGIGKRTLALRFAQAINCLNPREPGVPCRICRVCQQTERQQQPDLSIVRLLPENKEIKIEQVRELQHSLSMSPYEAKYRVALLLGFHNATIGAQNAMLKTLEEAPQKVILVLTADSQDGLLPTIISRCEVVRLRPLSLEATCAELLRRAALPEAQANLLAHLSGGRLGYALRLSESPGELDKRAARLDKLIDLLAMTRRARFSYIEELIRDRDRARDMLNLNVITWLSFWRDVLLVTAGADTPLVNLDREDQARRIASKLDLPAARKVAAALQATLERLDLNANTRLAGEVLMLELPRLAL